MAVKLDIRGDNRAILKDMTRCEKKKVPRATVQAINKTGNWFRGKVARQAANVLNLKLKLMRSRIVWLLASKRTFTGVLKVRHRSISWRHIGGRKIKGGVKAEGGRFAQSGFIAPDKGGTKRPFVRKGQAKKRKPPHYGHLPIRALVVFVRRPMLDAADSWFDQCPRHYRKEFSGILRRLFARP